MLQPVATDDTKDHWDTISVDHAEEDVLQPVAMDDVIFEGQSLSESL